MNNQQHATKYLPSLRNLPCEETFHKLKLPVLQYGQLRWDMIETYKLIMEKYDKAVASSLPKQ